MSEEQNIESAQPSEVPTPAAEASAAEAPAPRRRGRKPKAATASASDAPKTTEEAAETPAKPRRPRKTAQKGKDEHADAPIAESDEVRQARALAQISQASVVRRQRRAAERAAEMLTSGDEGRAGEGPVKKDPMPKAGTMATAQEPAQATLPLVDPALRPHRRGRKPKAYIEAEKAAAAALAAAQAAASTAAVEESAAPASAAPQAAEHSASDTRPGRATRARKASEETPEAAPATPAVEQAQQSAGEQDRQNHQERPGNQHRRTHQNRRTDKQEAAFPQNDRRGNRQQNQRNNKRNNNRFAPTEPSLTRDELSAMKVAELREKAKEFDVDGTGIKKAELVELVYAAAARAEGFRDIEGILDVTNEGFGYIRAHGYMPSRDDAFVAAQMIRAAGLRPGDLIAGTLRPARANDKFPGLAKLRSVNGMDPEEVRRRPKFADLTPIYPNEPLKMEHGKDSITGRAIDIVSPIGKGQRGLIVSPPKAGKTTILKKICQAISANNPEVHLICLLVDERPEEVTDMQRSIKGDVVASTFDMPADNHTRVSELVIERAKRIVELGGDVVVVLDSITRLARAYNLAAPASGRILSGGVDSAALYPPKRFLGAARNIENGGSLTILASALIDTGSKMDEVIFEEFKGTGNMELKLDRDLADRRIFPAIDPVASGTRNEDLLIDETMKPFVWGIRRILANMNNTERAAASFIKGLKSTNSNQEFLIRTAKKAADHPDAL